MAEPTTELPSEPKCKLCGRNSENGSTRCHDCQQAVSRANEFNGEHCVVPLRYREATSERLLTLGSGLLFTGPAGTGKTWDAFGLLRAARQADPRLFRAYCSWPQVLLMLRRGYSNQDDAAEAARTINALQVADVAMIDDLGAEKVSESNLAWLQENLYVILDHRYNWCATTILTTNLEPSRLAEYLGPRLASRILGMCTLVELSGSDRRFD